MTEVREHRVRVPEKILGKQPLTRRYGRPRMFWKWLIDQIIEDEISQHEKDPKDSRYRVKHIEVVILTEIDS